MYEHLDGGCLPLGARLATSVDERSSQETTVEHHKAIKTPNYILEDDEGEDRQNFSAQAAAAIGKPATAPIHQTVICVPVCASKHLTLFCYSQIPRLVEKDKPETSVRPQTHFAKTFDFIDTKQVLSESTPRAETFIGASFAAKESTTTTTSRNVISLIFGC